MMVAFKYLAVIIFTVLLASCFSTIHESEQLLIPSAVAQWGVAPFENHTQTPQAAETVSAIASAILRTKGVSHILMYRPKSGGQSLLTGMTESLSPQQMLNWARANRIKYILTGTVNEWRYKVGLDGEPAVNVSLTLWDATSGGVIWSTVGSSTGGSRSGLSSVGQSLIASMLSKLVVS